MMYNGVMNNLKDTITSCIGKKDGYRLMDHILSVTPVDDIPGSHLIEAIFSVSVISAWLEFRDPFIESAYESLERRGYDVVSNSDITSDIV